MSQQRIRELERELREERKAERKKKRKILGHSEKKQGTAYWEGDHEYIVDPVAKTKRRMEIFRNAGGEVIWFDESDPFSVEEIKSANCEGCAETHLVSWNSGEWNHVCPLEKKCDAAACGLFQCHKSHVEYHNRQIKSDKVERREKESPA